jgi:SAM-dependent methyltransferase
MRMVAEHIVDPHRSVAKVAELLKTGGLVVIYTPNKWAPVPVITRLVPNRWHWHVKRMMWDGEARDTFPTAFKLNTRKALTDHCARHGLDELYFDYLDDCRTFDAYHWLNCAELAVQRVLHSLAIRYPENCLLGVYRKR